MSAELPSYEEAAAVVARYAARLEHRVPAVERVPLALAGGRVMAQELAADQDQPPFTRSTRDGFACRASEASAHAWLSLAGSIRAGEALPKSLAPGAALEIMTGAPVPEGADCVAMLEHVERTPGHVRLTPPRTMAAGHNLVRQGAQARKGDVLLGPGVRVGFEQIALAASCGAAILDVYVKPRVAILTTGDEIVPMDAEPRPGQIRNSNGPMLAALVAAAGGEPRMLPATADDAAALDAVLALAAEADLLVISGGVSAGKFDLVEPALLRAGANLHFTGVRIQPGKPLVFGDLPKGSEHPEQRLPFFGLPGNPISSAVTFLLFAAPVLSALAGSGEPSPQFALAQMGPKVERHPKAGLTRFLPAACTFTPGSGQMPEVEFVPWHGSGDLAALARSNCFLVVPEKADPLEPGVIVRILLSGGA
jgi:molybdopterin molybdotransferase